MTELELVRHIRCPLWVEEQESDLEACALKLVKVGLLSAFNKRAKTLAELRELFVRYWDELWLKSHEKIPATGPYWEGPKAARTVATKVYWLTKRFEVISPVTPYQIQIGSYTIQSKYALVRSRGESRKVSAVVIHTQPWFRHQPPHLLTLIRYFSLITEHPEYRNPDVLHVPLFRGKPWRQEPKNLPLILAGIEAALSSYVAGHSYPSPGSHCDTCITKSCLEVFHDRPNDHSGSRRLTQISYR